MKTAVQPSSCWVCNKYGTKTLLVGQKPKEDADWLFVCPSHLEDWRFGGYIQSDPPTAPKRVPSKEIPAPVASTSKTGTAKKNKMETNSSDSNKKPDVTDPLNTQTSVISPQSSKIYSLHPKMFYMRTVEFNNKRKARARKRLVETGLPSVPGQK